MAKVRNVSPDTLVVPLLGGRVVEPDEVVEVGDDLFLEHDWPESTWAVVSAPKRKLAPAPTTEE